MKKARHSHIKKCDFVGMKKSGALNLKYESMATFLNLNLDNEINPAFFWKHLLFSAFWIVGILLFLFRLDIYLLDKYSISASWIRIAIPTAYFALLITYCCFLKWYTLLFISYPLFLFGWFIPKFILRNGKVYLLGNYLSSIYSFFANWRVSLAKLFLYISSFLLLLTIGSNWTRWFALFAALVFYMSFIYRSIKQSFGKPALFSGLLEEKIKERLAPEKVSESIIVKSYVAATTNANVAPDEQRKGQISRVVYADFFINVLLNKMTGMNAKRAFLRAWVIQSVIFLLISIIFFWFANFQLYKIDSAQYVYEGRFPVFDFFYYTLKTGVFGDIETLKAVGVLARILAIAAFSAIGVFVLIICVHIAYHYKQEQLSENIELAAKLFDNERSNLMSFLNSDLGVNSMEGAMAELQNIQESLVKLRKFLDNIF